MEIITKIIEDIYQSEATIRCSKKNIIPIIPEEGVSEEKIIELWEMIVKNSTHLSSAKMFAHMDTSPHPIAAYTDALISALNNNLLFRELSPFASDVEAYMCKEIARRLGLCEHTQGMFCSGGSLANLTALFAACGGFQETDLQRNNCYLFLSETTHASLKKSAMVLGIPTSNIITIPCHKDGVIKIDKLEDAIASHKHAYCIVNATLGTTLHGAIDPIRKIAQLKNQYGFWLHVDAIYGGAICFSEHHCQLLDGIECADSVTIAPQKWMYVPRVSAIVYLKNKKPLEMPVPYSISEESHLGNWGIQGSRRADAITLWVTLHAMGTKRLGHIIDDRINFTSQCYQLLESHPLFTPLHKPQLNLLLFTTKQQSNLRGIHMQLTANGQESISLASWQGCDVFRCVFLNTKTKLSHFNNVLDSISTLL